MTAEEIYQVLDTAGLVPSVPYIAASHDWRSTLERIEVMLEAEVFEFTDEIGDNERAIASYEEVNEELRADVAALEAQIKAYRQIESQETAAQ